MSDAPLTPGTPPPAGDAPPPQGPPAPPKWAPIPFEESPLWQQLRDLQRLIFNDLVAAAKTGKLDEALLGAVVDKRFRDFAEPLAGRVAELERLAALTWKGYPPGK